jgi:hypothetical protein
MDHDVEKEGVMFRTLMADATWEEMQAGRDLIVKGLTADEVIEIIEKKREFRAP